MGWGGVEGGIIPSFKGLKHLKIFFFFSCRECLKGGPQAQVAPLAMPPGLGAVGTHQSRGNSVSASPTTLCLMTQRDGIKVKKQL